MKKNIVIALVIMAIATGCYRTPDIENSKLENIDDIQVEKNSESTLAFNSYNWWTIYQDENLNLLVDLVTESNLDLDIALVNIEKANEGISKVKGARLPSANISADAARTKIEDSNTSLLDNSRTDRYDIGLNATYDLDFFNKLSSLEKSQEFVLKAQELQRDLVRLHISTLTTQLYGYHIYLDKVNENLNERINILEEVRTMTLIGIEAGQNIEDDLLKIDNEINDLKGAIKENSLDKDTTMESLNLLASYKNTSEIKELLDNATTDSKILNKKLATPEKVASTVVANRPDVKYYLMIIKSQEYKLKSIEADYYPQFSITGSLTKSKIDFRNGFSPSALAWSLGPQVYLPIFNMSQIDAEYKVAGLDLEGFIKEYNKTLLTSFKDINVELAATKVAKNTLSLKEENLNNSNKLLSDSKIKLELGAISKYELLLDKYNNLEDILVRENSRYSSYKEQVSLINSLGGVYKEIEPSNTNTKEHNQEA